MPGMDRREVAYTEARAELMREIAERGLSYLDQSARGEAISGIVRRLERAHPELDDQMARRLIGEGMRREPVADDSPPEGELDT